MPDTKPTPEQFVTDDPYIHRNDDGTIWWRLDGREYQQLPLGEDYIQLFYPPTGETVATLGYEDGKFVVVKGLH